MFLNGKSAGKENRDRKIIFDIHIRMSFRFDQANKKKSVICTLSRQFNYCRANFEKKRFAVAHDGGNSLCALQRYYLCNVLETWKSFKKPVIGAALGKF